MEYIHKKLLTYPTVSILDVNSVPVGINVLCFDLVFKSCCLGVMLVSILCSRVVRLSYLKGEQNTFAPSAFAAHAETTDGGDQTAGENTSNDVMRATKPNAEYGSVRVSVQSSSTGPQTQESINPYN